MPRRNLIVIFLALIICVVCYRRADRTPYTRVFGRAMDLIARKYVEPVEKRELFEGAMEGMVRRLDEHSAYIGPETLRQFQADLDQEFGGIGIEVTIDRESERLMVMSPLLDTPAYLAGMRAGDIILKIDGQDTEGMGLRESVKIMRGKPGTNILLSVLHRGDDEPVDFEITRAVIQTESVLGDLRDRAGKWQYFLEETPRIGYIRVTTFGEHTVAELRDALQFNAHQVDALILDLRNNAGGLLTGAVEVCDMFISDGRIVSSRGRGGKPEAVFSAHAEKTVFPADIPIAVLVNGFSASAAEIVAACLKDHGRAKIVGTRTWGKGTVQNVIHLEGGKSVLKLTTASYWRPNNQNIHRRRNATDEDQWGVKPDSGFEVELDKDQTEKVFLQRRERDIIRIDENGEVQPPEPIPPAEAPSGKDVNPAADDDPQEDANDDAGKDDGRDAGDDDGKDDGRDAGKDDSEDAGEDAGKDDSEDAGEDDGKDAGEEDGEEAVRKVIKITGEDAAKDAENEADRDAEEDAEEDVEGTADSEQADEGPIGDPQLRRAIEYLETQLSETRAAA